jgi:hypothetical protein
LGKKNYGTPGQNQYHLDLGGYWAVVFRKNSAWAFVLRDGPRLSANVINRWHGFGSIRAAMAEAEYQIACLMEGVTPEA